MSPFFVEQHGFGGGRAAIDADEARRPCSPGWNVAGVNFLRR